MMLQFFAQRTPYNRKISLTINQPYGEHGTAFALPLTMEAKKEGEYVEPCVLLTHDEAQALMDELWNAGLRPTEGTGSAGAMAAVQAHLQDMRTLVFDKMKGE